MRRSLDWSPGEWREADKDRAEAGAIIATVFAELGVPLDTPEKQISPTVWSKSAIAMVCYYLSEEIPLVATNTAEAIK